MKTTEKHPARILLLKMDHIGDALWSFPAIHALRTACPDAVIDMLCTPYLAEAFCRLGDLNRVVEYDLDVPRSERQAVIRQLKNPRYDVVINLGPVDKVNHLVYFTGAPERVGYAYAGSLVRTLTRNFFLTRHYPHPADVAARSGKPLPHEVTALLSLVARQGAAVPADPQLFFPLNSEERQSAADYLRGLLPGKNAFAALHLCAKSFRHGWDGAAFAGLAAQLQKAVPDVGWIVTAGPAEEYCLETYRAALEPSGIPVVNGLNLGGMAALLAQMRLLVSWDTGVVHLASAVGTPVVDIFPAKDYDYCVQRWGPWGPGGHPVCQPGDVLDSSTVETVLRLVREISASGLEARLS